MTISRFGHALIAVGLSITLFAMALDEWTSLHELELISGCAGLLTSIVAAIMVVCDSGGLWERRHELSGPIPGPVSWARFSGGRRTNE